MSVYSSIHLFVCSECLPYAIEAIEGGYTIGFGHCGIVEGGVDEVHEGIGFAFLGHNGLANMDNF